MPKEAKELMELLLG